MKVWLYQDEKQGTTEWLLGETELKEMVFLTVEKAVENAMNKIDALKCEGYYTDDKIPESKEMCEILEKEGVKVFAFYRKVYDGFEESFAISIKGLEVVC